MQEMGVSKGDKVLVYMPDTSSTVVTYLAIWRLGAVALPINCHLGVNLL